MLYIVLWISLKTLRFDIFSRALPGQRGYGVKTQGSSFGARKKGTGNQSYGVGNAIVGSEIPFNPAPRSPGVRQPSALDPAAG